MAGFGFNNVAFVGSLCTAPSTAPRIFIIDSSNGVATAAIRNSFDVAGVTSNIIDSSGVSSPYTIGLATGNVTENSYGMTTDYLGFDGASLATAHFISPGGVAVYQFTNLDNNKIYDLTLLGSRKGVADARITKWTVNGIVKTVNSTAADSSGMGTPADFTNLRSTGGVLQMKMELYSGSYAYLNVGRLTERTL